MEEWMLKCFCSSYSFNWVPFKQLDCSRKDSLLSVTYLESETKCNCVDLTCQIRCSKRSEDESNPIPRGSRALNALWKSCQKHNWVSSKQYSSEQSCAHNLLVKCKNLSLLFCEVGLLDEGASPFGSLHYSASLARKCKIVIGTQDTKHVELHDLWLLPFSSWLLARM